jgi:hypothetical protein
VREAGTRKAFAVRVVTLLPEHHFRQCCFGNVRKVLGMTLRRLAHSIAALSQGRIGVPGISVTERTPLSIASWHASLNAPTTYAGASLGEHPTLHIVVDNCEDDTRLLEYPVAYISPRICRRTPLTLL